MTMPHDNSHDNDKPHHLYEIWDETEAETFKYGVSAKPIGEDGLSSRMREQLTLLNLATNILRYIGRILHFNIPGREEAERMEDEYIDAFEEKYGRKPRGNRKRNRKKN